MQSSSLKAIALENAIKCLFKGHHRRRVEIKTQTCRLRSPTIRYSYLLSNTANNCQSLHTN